MMFAKLSPHRFWPLHENRLIKKVKMIPPQPICEFQVEFEFGLSLALIINWKVVATEIFLFCCRIDAKKKCKQCPKSMEKNSKFSHCLVANT